MAKIEGAGLGQRLVADYAPRLQPRAGRIHRLVYGGAAARRVHEGDRHRLARGTRGPQARPDFDQCPYYSRPQAGGRGGRQRAPRAGAGGGDRPDQGRPVARGPHRELAIAPPGSGAPERAGCADEEGTGRPCHVRDPARVRIAPIRTGEPDDETRPAAGQPLVHRRPGRQAWASADYPDARVGEKRDRCVDRGLGRYGGASVPANQSGRSGLRRSGNTKCTC
jgi:hypothetical protein